MCSCDNAQKIADEHTRRADDEAAAVDLCVSSVMRGEMTKFDAAKELRSMVGTPLTAGIRRIEAELTYRSKAAPAANHY